MSLPKSVALAIGIAALTAPAAAHAAAIFETLLPDGSWKVTINGEIVQGDTTSFFNTINRVERNHGRISSVHLNSPGGLVVEGLEIGNKIKSRQFMTIVERGDHCEFDLLLHVHERQKEDARRQRQTRHAWREHRRKGRAGGHLAIGTKKP